MAFNSDRKRMSVICRSPDGVPVPHSPRCCPARQPRAVANNWRDRLVGQEAPSIPNLRTWMARYRFDHQTRFIPEGHIMVVVGAHARISGTFRARVIHSSILMMAHRAVGTPCRSDPPHLAATPHSRNIAMSGRRGLRCVWFPCRQAGAVLQRRGQRHVRPDGARHPPHRGDRRPSPDQGPPIHQRFGNQCFIWEMIFLFREHAVSVLN